MNTLAWILGIYFVVTRVPVVVALFMLSAATIFGPNPKYPLPILFVQWLFGMLPIILFWTCPIWADFVLYPPVIGRLIRMLFYRIRHGNLDGYWEAELQRKLELAWNDDE